MTQDESEFAPEALQGPERDLTAFGAAVDALSGTGRVDITTEENGRPQFSSVGVWDLQSSLDAEADPVIAIEASAQVSATGDQASPAPGTAGTVTNDPLYDQQWSDRSVPYSPAWACTQGSGIDIAVVDTGVDRSHPDLAAHTTTGAGALGGSGTVSPGTGGIDPHGHGTHVAGIAAASAGNGLGIAGVAPMATIIPVRVLGETGSGWNIDVAAGITWAVDSGAEVVNLSLGSTWRSSAVSNAIAYAVSRGVVVVAAAGNDGPSGAKHYPGADANSIAVGSVDENLQISDFSTHGDYVDVSAPGSAILSTYLNGSYATLSGTSMATPYVSGVVALMLGTHPTLGPAQIRARLTSTADDAGPNGPDQAFGYGIVDPVRAIGN